MVTRIGSFRRKTRAMMTKRPRTKGKISMTRYFQKFDVGDMVQLNIEPAVQKGTYDTRFFGKMGKVVSKKGRCYIIEIMDRSKKKSIIAHPVHLLKVKR